MHIPMTHAPETVAINRLHFLAPKLNVAESDVDDEFAETATIIIIAGIVALVSSTGINHK